jgi:hypothetical protein
VILLVDSGVSIGDAGEKRASLARKETTCEGEGAGERAGGEGEGAGERAGGEGEGPAAGLKSWNCGRTTVYDRCLRLSASGNGRGDGTARCLPPSPSVLAVAWLMLVDWACSTHTLPYRCLEGTWPVSPTRSTIF